jgi:hypothetical protein
MAVSENECAYTVNLGHRINLSAVDNNVRTRAALHYMSPIVSTASLSYVMISQYPYSATLATFKVPITVTNSNPYSSFTNNSNWFGSASVTQTFNIVNICSNIQGNSLTDLNIDVFPNPCSDAFTLEFETQQNGAIQLLMLNPLGQVVRKENYNTNLSTDKIKVDVRNLPRGLYILNLKSGQNVWSKKIIVE